jgi:histone H3/H4
MNQEEILKKTNELGLTTTPEIINQISDMVSKIAVDTMLTAGEVEALTNIMILKACDTALLDKRTIITVSDVLSSLNFVCVPFFFRALKVTYWRIRVLQHPLLHLPM